METFFNRVYQVVKQIPKGKVATYGQVATLMGCPRCSRQVGYALHANPNQQQIPCHRVVNRFGQVCEGFVFGGADIQKQMLIDEGVQFNNNQINLDKFLWEPK